MADVIVPVIDASSTPASLAPRGANRLCQVDAAELVRRRRPHDVRAYMGTATAGEAPVPGERDVAGVGRAVQQGPQDGPGGGLDAHRQLRRPDEVHADPHARALS